MMNRSRCRRVNAHVETFVKVMSHMRACLDYSSLDMEPVWEPKLQSRLGYTQCLAPLPFSRDTIRENSGVGFQRKRARTIILGLINVRKDCSHIQS